MRTWEKRQSVRGRENYGYERVSVEMQRRGGYGESRCDITIDVDGNVLGVVNEGLQGVKEMLM